MGDGLVLQRLGRGADDLTRPAVVHVAAARADGAAALPYRDLSHRGFRLTPYSVASIILGVVLVVAATLKVHYLVTKPIFGSTFWTDRPLMVAGSLTEIACGFWLLFGIAQTWARLAAIGLFTVFTAVATIQTIRGEPTCSCFGEASIHPVYVAIGDLSALVALCLARPSRDASRRRSRRRLTTFVIATVAAETVAAVVIVRHWPVVNSVFEFPPQLYDRGSDSSLPYELPIVNTTDRSVRFKEIRSSCGCAQTALLCDTLEPGESTVLQTRIRPLGNIGVRTVSIALFDDMSIAWTYTLKTIAYPRVALDSPDLFVGTVPLGEERTVQTVIHTYNVEGNEPAYVRRLTADSACVRATVQGSRRSDHANGVTHRLTTVEIRVSATKALDQQRCTLTIHCKSGSDAFRDSDAFTASESLGINWSVQPPYEVHPSRLFFGDVRNRSETVQQTLTLRRMDGKPFTLIRARGSHPCLACSVNGEDPRHIHKIQVELDLSRLKEPIHERITILTDHPVYPELIVPVAVLQ